MAARPCRKDISIPPLYHSRYSGRGTTNPTLSFLIPLKQAALVIILYFFQTIELETFLLALPGTPAHSAHDRFVDIDIPVPDFQVVAAIRVGTNPCLVKNRCPLASEIGKGYQVSATAFLAFRKINLFHEVHLPAEIVAMSIHQLTIYLQGYPVSFCIVFVVFSLLLFEIGCFDEDGEIVCDINTSKNMYILTSKW
jgi:hypothetical protein